MNIDHISQELLTLAVKELDYSSLWNNPLSDELLNVSLNSWMEYNLNYAQVVKDDGEHFFKAGGKLKFLRGMGSFYLFADEIDYDFLNDSIVNQLDGNFSYGYSQNASQVVDARSLENADLFSFSKVISRCLKTYIKDGTKSSVKICQNCGSEDSIVYQEGCEMCKACGSSKCG